MVKFYDSLQRKKVEIEPSNHRYIKMYTCGPTVYYYPHIGNWRAYLFMDNIRRVLRYCGYQIEGVMNITDVGHLTSDADEGDDKMLVASEREHKTPWEIAKYYTDVFMRDAKRLNIDLPEHVVPATSVMSEIVEFVKGLIARGYAYETSKGIYFEISKFEDYGQLSGMNIKEKLAGARIEVDDEKHSPYDFVLWVKAPKEHIMQWDSPWGRGYPGWHIECSVIGDKYFGDTIDIHTGGVDHKTVHHENEIAQSNALYGKQVVKHWMHLEFLQIDNGKMGKSLGNTYTLDDLEEQGFEPEVYRYFYFMAHYSKQQNFNRDAMEGAKNSLKNLKSSVSEHKKGTASVDTTEYERQFEEAVADDLNMPKALAVVLRMLKEPKSADVYKTFLKFNEVLGFDLDNKDIPKEIENLARDRWQAKKDRNFELADKLRKEILDKGYEIKDSKDGYDINKI